MSSKHYKGLTDSEVAASREKYGVNILTPAEKTPLWKQFLQKFRDPLIIILMIAGVLSIGISCYEYFGIGKPVNVFFEPVGIFIAVLLATGLAFYFEMRAEKEFELLNKVNDDEPVKVIRNGRLTQVAKKDIVVGDIVILSTGEEVPADGELLEATSLSIDESTLTGEPVCHKTTEPEHFDANATYPSNYAMRGTKVMEGHGVMKITAVGDHTENGKVFTAAQIDDHVKTPLSEQLDRLGTLISRITYIIAAVIVACRIFMFLTTFPDADFLQFIDYLLNTFMIAVALIVVAVPEGLPMAVTLSLAYSMRRMLKTNNLVRKLHACETMGATTVICTDKTGTLTQNRMQVAETDFLIDENSPLVSLGIAANSTAQLSEDEGKTEVIGNPTEGALLLWLQSRGIDYRKIKDSCNILQELPFTTELKYMATLVATDGGKRLLLVKGAPEIVYEMCSQTAVSKEDIASRLHGYQSRGMRTLAFAYKEVEGEENVIASGKIAVSDLVFIGIVAISDPVREDVPAAVAECQSAGIAIKIVTGDTPLTAREIGRQIGLWSDEDTDRNIITGPEFAALSDEELLDRVMDIKIIARARPMDKKRLVEALRKKGQVVAVTGDGTNDAPALKAAHVGLSMGDGTSVAKEASDITIIDNSFSSIGRAVMWGRSLYRNIQRFILFQLTVNVVACLTVFAGAVLGTESPLTVTQMLWVNLIMDTFAAMALASLPPSEKVMADKPRDRKAFIINRDMWGNILGVGFVMFLVMLTMLVLMEQYDVTSMINLFAFDEQPMNIGGRLTAYELSLFFTFFVFLQFWNMFNARAFGGKSSALNLSHCSEFGFIATAIFVGQLLIITVGGAFFNVKPLTLEDWIVIIAATSFTLWIGEAVRLVKRQHDKNTI
ncbi:MAG: calcium-translocating P-type ATPase, PMCA-type [Muribaculaceae bacterium]